MRKLLGALALFALPLFAAEPTVKVGGTIFADLTDAPDTSSFNISRAYINVTGSLNDRITFRITPDIARDAGGSQQFRLKYAYGQLSLDQWLTKGSFLRAGMQQTPYIDSLEQIYRYRFQGSVFADREGFLSSSDNGVSLRYVLPGERGDVHAGVYNGEGYNKNETNDQKSLQVRATLRPVKGLRTTLFFSGDHYAEDAPRERLIGQVTYEHARFTAGAEVLKAKDRDKDSDGWSAFATPKLGNGWELLLRHDDNGPRKRNITGVAYWLPNLQKATAAVLLDRDSLSVDGKPDETRYAVKVLLVF